VVLGSGPLGDAAGGAVVGGVCVVVPEAGGVAGCCAAGTAGACARAGAAANATTIKSTVMR